MKDPSLLPSAKDRSNDGRKKSIIIALKLKKIILQGEIDVKSLTEFTVYVFLYQAEVGFNYKPL